MLMKKNNVDPETTPFYNEFNDVFTSHQSYICKFTTFQILEVPFVSTNINLVRSITRIINNLGVTLEWTSEQDLHLILDIL